MILLNHESRCCFTAPCTRKCSLPVVNKPAHYNQIRHPIISHQRPLSFLVAMDSILSYERNPNNDYYSILGCDELSSMEQINAEYKLRALECHPDKNPDNPEAAAKFAKLQRAKEVLSDENLKKDYDTWRHSGLAMDYENWLQKKNTIHVSMHWGIRKKEPMIEAAKQFSLSEKPGCSWQNDQSDILRKFRNYEI